MSATRATTTCEHCRKSECEPRYMTLSYKYNEAVSLKYFTKEFGKVAADSDIKINRYAVTSLKTLPLVKYVWLDVDESLCENELRMKLTLGAPNPGRSVLPIVTPHYSCGAALAEVLKSMEDMNAEGERAAVKEFRGGSPGVIRF